ncbi:hypothetical protein [Mycoplasma sp. 005V]|uniref:hypothetical protein n=1 Tax=unclassified Mycoplasma TaxID=2683645 RepID=UPI003A84EDAF
MNTLFEVAASASAQSESSSSASQFEDIIKILKNITNSVGNAAIWLPIVIIALLVISFLIGFWFNYKWSIFKFAAIVLTMIISAIVFKFASEAIQRHLENENEANQIFRSGLPFALTIFAIICYLSLRGLFFVITFIIHLARINKRKEKKTKRIANGKRGNRIWTRLLFGTTNVVLTIPGTLLLSNLVTTAMVDDATTSKTTNIGVKIMTGGKGASLSGIGIGTISLLELFQKGSKLFNTLQNPENKWTKEELKDIVDTLHSSAALLNNQDVRNTISNIAKDVAAKNAPEIAQKTGVNKYIEDTRKELEKENPLFVTLSPEEQSKEVTKYAINQIKSIDNYDQLGMGEEVAEYLNVAKYVISAVSDDTRKSLAHIFAETLNSAPSVKNQINAEAVINELFNSLSNFKLDKETKQKDKQESAPVTETNTNNNTQPAVANN